MIASMVVKYALHCYDRRLENPWENKSMYFFYIDLTVGTHHFIFAIMIMQTL